STKIKSETRELVESFPVTNENYPLAIESLTERYGQKELLIDFYVRELLKLVLNNATKKKQDSLSSLYNKLSTQLRALNDKKKRLHWLLGTVLELFPGKDGIIRLVKLRTEKGNVLRPIQRLYPLELKPNYEQVASENLKGPEVVTEYPELNTDSNKTVPVTSSGREIKPVKRLDL
ncbi:hypothetical protein NPIL_93711, partial [Nephila pilipes]